MLWLSRWLAIFQFVTRFWDVTLWILAALLLIEILYSCFHLQTLTRLVTGKYCFHFPLKTMKGDEEPSLRKLEISRYLQTNLNEPYRTSEHLKWTRSEDWLRSIWNTIRTGCCRKQSFVSGAILEFVIRVSQYCRVLFRVKLGRSPLGCNWSFSLWRSRLAPASSLCNKSEVRWHLTVEWFIYRCSVFDLFELLSVPSALNLFVLLVACRSYTLTQTHYGLIEVSCLALLGATSAELRVPLPSFAGDVYFLV